MWFPKRQGALVLQRLDFRQHYKKLIAEQEEAENYVLKKPLQRPKTNAFTLLFIGALYLVSAFLIAFLTIKSLKINDGKVYIYLFSYILCFIFSFKFFCIKAVECYQHYAKEETRRRCLCMPTCSEYAISALKKYCLIKALIKIHKRLFRTCRGGFYKKDPLS